MNRHPAGATRVSWAVALVVASIAALSVQAVAAHGADASDAARLHATARPHATAARVCRGGGRRLTKALGVYTGAADPADAASFASRTGAHLRVVSDYLPAGAGWSGMTTNLNWMLRPWARTGCTLVLGVPLIPTNAAGTRLGSLAAGATGAYDSYFVTLARSLVAGGQAHAVLRLGWEFNGNWYPWQVTNATDAADFVSYWRHIVDAMRTVRREAFRFAWNPNGMSSFGSAYGPDQAYPGNSYVTYVGTDVYDQCWCSPETPANAWSLNYYQAWGLQWLASFARATGKQIVIPEWGVTIRPDGHGLGDDPSFITNLTDWVAANDVAWTSYFNYDAPDGSHDLFDPSFPKSLAVFDMIH